MKPQSKLIITEYRDKIVSVLTEDSRPVQISLESKEQESILGNIYIGRVQNIVKNINAAFVEIAPGITGYYSLTENRRHWLGDKPEERTLRIGDEIMVQVEKDGIKTQAPMLTSSLSLAGKYCVLTVLFPNISFSGKIRSSQWKETVKGLIEARKQPSYGVIVRTNARDAGHEEILQELDRLSGEFEKILAQRAFRACYSLLCEASPPFLREIRNVYTDTLTAIVTDKQELYDEIFRYLSFNQPEDLDKLTFYEDSLLSLSSLYSLETVIGEALQPRVWLKSGGYLVIEPTEALTVIDVNTGKFSGHKNPQDTLMKINLEAARAVARELRLRNLSGIIVVDFIDMESEENRKLLMETLRSAVRKDPVKTTVVDMTKLGLIEITRKKVRPSLYQQAR
ncbi:MAG: ribonuclease E/G [Lachnospiraceae bacterium]|nr:ribonuclease E/G [Lachnospiraceae bacterium]